MLRLIGIAVSIGLADSLNPSTIAPALYLATGERARDNVIKFTAGVFLVYFLGGAFIALGPGQLLLSLVPKPDHQARDILELIAGAAMLAAGTLLWRNRVKLSDREPPSPDVEGRSSALLGAGITAVELPTAFPYFAAIAAIVGSGLDIERQVVLLVLFNVCFVLPLIAIVITLYRFGPEAEAKLVRAREWLTRHWAVVLAVLALVAGTFVIALGVTGLAFRHRGHVAQLIRQVRSALS